MFGWIAAISRPSLIMPSASTVVAFTSPLIGPSTMDVISLITSLKSLPSFAIRDGFVVTPQITPISFALRISSTFAVSIKISYYTSPFLCVLVHTTCFTYDNLFYLKLQPCFCVFMILHNFFACMCTLFTKQVFASKYAHAFPVFNDKTVPQSVSHV